VEGKSQQNIWLEKEIKRRLLWCFLFQIHQIQSKKHAQTCNFQHFFIITFFTQNKLVLFLSIFRPTNKHKKPFSFLLILCSKKSNQLECSTLEMDRPPWNQEESAVDGGQAGGLPTTHALTLPPRTDNLFSGGFSPGPMTLLSNLLTDGEDGKSFSQLLAGAMASPAAATAGLLDSPGFFSHPQVKILLFVYVAYIYNSG
jgi:hypothetical protein